MPEASVGANAAMYMPACKPHQRNHGPDPGIGREALGALQFFARTLQGRIAPNWEMHRFQKQKHQQDVRNGARDEQLAVILLCNEAVDIYVTEGGIMTPSVPPAATTPEERLSA